MDNCDIRCLESVMIYIELMKLQVELSVRESRPFRADSHFRTLLIEKQIDIFQERKRKISRFFFDESSADI